MATTPDEGFREIQLSGKHLVFLFMAGTVMAVVIFLSGVMVGRGVRAERGVVSGLTDAGTGASAANPAAPTSAAGTAGQPVTTGEKLSYAERLNAPAPGAEQLQKAEPPEPADEAVTPAPPAEAPRAAAPTALAGAPRAEAGSGEPPGPGYAIQVAALRGRGEADAIVRRLSGKGYPAYVLAPARGAPTVYRVRVGKYKDRREADSVAARLQREEQFKPWVVR
jgi:cell division septation protein DedD